MTVTVFLVSTRGGLQEHEAEEVTDYLSALGVWWRRNPERDVEGAPVYEPSSAPGPQRSKHEWTAQLADEDSYSMGEGARREMFEED